MTTNDTALNVLQQNKPIEWLLGTALRAIAAKGESHFILDALAGSNPPAVRAWNAWISEFRNVLRNPDDAVRKANAELSTGPAKRIDDFMAEVFAVLRLSRSGYEDFEVVLQEKLPTVDYVARNAGKRVRIEVKRLQEAQDIIRSIASARWRECQSKAPQRFNFRAILSHSYHGPLSDAAISKLKNVIDQFPERATGKSTVTLDGNIPITLRRISTSRPRSPEVERDVFLLTTTFPAQRTGLVVTSTITERDLEFDLPELQRLFVKAFRTVGEATPKFFGRQSEPEAENLIAMQWEAPKLFFDDGSPLTVGKAIESAFSAVGLQLKVLIFSGDIAPNYHFLRTER